MYYNKYDLPKILMSEKLRDASSRQSGLLQYLSLCASKSDIVWKYILFEKIIFCKKKKKNLSTLEYSCLIFNKYYFEIINMTLTK